MNCTQVTEPPYAERHVRWCERTAVQIMDSLLLDLTKQRKKMEERLTKIAETSFRKAMAEFSYWGDIGIALKNIQSEIREVSKRTRTVEHILGHPWNYGQNAKTSADKTSSEIRHLSGEQIKQIRLRKKLKISHMAQLLNVSIRKYTEWERGISLMAPWVRMRF